MPIVNKETWEELPFDRYPSGCGWSGSTQKLWTGASSLVTPDPVRRVKPTCLVCSPTSRACFAYQEWKAGIWVYDIPYGCTVDPSGRAEIWYPYQDNYLKGAVLVQPQAPDWATCIRLQLKNQAVNLAVVMGEYRETCSMFHDVVTLFRDVYKDYRKWKRNPVGNFARKVLGTSRKKGWAVDRTAQTILLTNFGVLPLMGDLYDSIEKMQKVNSLMIRLRCTKKESEQRIIENYAGWRLEGRFDLSCRAIFYVWLDANHISSGGFTGGNPLEVAWELTPFSFVLDWMIPVGDYLASLDALNGVKSAIGTVTTRATQTFSQELVPFGEYPGAVGKSFRDHKWFDDRCDREAFAEIPMGHLPFKYEPSDSFNAVINGTSLLRQIRKSG